MVGSMMVFEGSSLEEVKKIIESDLYYISDVVSIPSRRLHTCPCIREFDRSELILHREQWDPERIVILPFSGEPANNIIRYERF